MKLGELRKAVRLTERLDKVRDGGEMFNAMKKAGLLK